MRPLSCYLVQVEIHRNRGVAVDFDRCARQAVEIREDEPTDAVQFEGFVQHSVEFCEELFPG